MIIGNSPKVSVLMSVYNAERYLKDSIESILNQTFNSFEFIIINDGSSDSSLDIINHYKSTDDRIVLIDRENKGLIRSLNEGIGISRGEYIARMDADDISLDTRLEKQYRFMRENSEVGVCGTGTINFGEGIKKSKWFPSSNDKQLKAELLFSSCFAHPSVMIRKSLLVDNNIFYEEEFKHAEDFRLWTVLSDYTKFSNLNEVLLKYRVLNDSITRQADKALNDRFFIISNIFNAKLKKLEINNTREENMIHFNLSVNTRLKESKISLVELQQYFNKISAQNSKIGYLNGRELNLILGKKWLLNLYCQKNIRAIFSKYFYFGLLYTIQKLTNIK